MTYSSARGVAVGGGGRDTKGEETRREESTGRERREHRRESPVPTDSEPQRLKARKGGGNERLWAPLRPAPGQKSNSPRWRSGTRSFERTRRSIVPSCDDESKAERGSAGVRSGAKQAASGAGAGGRRGSEERFVSRAPARLPEDVDVRGFGHDKAGGGDPGGGVVACARGARAAAAALPAAAVVAAAAARAAALRLLVASARAWAERPRASAAAAAACCRPRLLPSRPACCPRRVRGTVQKDPPIPQLPRRVVVVHQAVEAPNLLGSLQDVRRRHRVRHGRLRPVSGREQTAPEAAADAEKRKGLRQRWAERREARPRLARGQPHDADLRGLDVHDGALELVSERALDPAGVAEDGAARSADVEAGEVRGDLLWEREGRRAGWEE